MECRPGPGGGVRRAPLLLRIFLVAALATVPASSRAEGKIGEAYTYDDIPSVDLLTRVYPELPHEDAIILVDYGVHGYHLRRIKVLTEEGKKHADVKLPFSRDELRFVKAHTVLPDGRRIDVKDFYDEGVEELRQTVFTFPGVQPGAVLEYEYSGPWTPWYFQNELHTRLSRFEAGNRYEEHFRALRGPRPEKTPVPRDSFAWEMRDVEPIEPEPFVRSLDRHRTAMYFGYDVKAGNPWPRLGQAYWAGADKILKKGGVKEWAEEQVEGLEDERARAEALYLAVRDGIDMLRTKDAPSSLPKVLKQRTGTIYLKNLLLMQAARDVGLEADLVLICTRDHGEFLPGHADPNQLNYTLVRLVANGQETFLDTNDRHCPFGFLPSNLRGETGLLILEEDSHTIPIRVPPVESKRTAGTRARLDERGNLSARTVLTFSGFRELEARRALEAGAKEFATEIVTRRYPAAVVDTAAVREPAEDGGALSVDVDWSCPGVARSAGTVSLLTVPLLTGVDENPLTRETRFLPMEFDYPYEEVELAVISLPEGWRAIRLPKGAEIGAPRASYHVSHWQAPGEIRVKRGLSIKTDDIPAEDYAQMKALFAAAVAGDGEKPELRPAP